MSIPEPYYADDAVQLFLGDFRKLLPLVVPDPSLIDLIMSDPPYGETSLAWDRWPDGWPSQVPGRSMWCFGSMRMFLDHRDEFRDAGWKLSQDVVWEKHNGSGLATDRFMRVHEFALHFYRGPWSDIHAVPPRFDTGGKRGVIRRSGQAERTRGVQRPSLDVRDGSTLARSVIFAQSMQGRAINETEKPAGLVEHLITYGCPPGGLVVDIFAGGCSTLVAARNSGRRAIGFELREEQCAKAVEWRLSQAPLPFGEAS